MKLSKQYNFYIVEDDHWSEFAYNHEIVPFYSLETPIENVIGLRGFSKVIGPDARIGALFASKEIIDEVEKLSPCSHSVYQIFLRNIYFRF